MRALVSTGLAVVLPTDTVGHIVSHPRQELGIRHGIEVGTDLVYGTTAHSPIKVLLYNHTESVYRVACGDCIAQLVVVPVVACRVVEIGSSCLASE